MLEGFPQSEEWMQPSSRGARCSRPFGHMAVQQVFDYLCDLLQTGIQRSEVPGEEPMSHGQAGLVQIGNQENDAQILEEMRYGADPEQVIPRTANDQRDGIMVVRLPEIRAKSPELTANIHLSFGNDRRQLLTDAGRSDLKYGSVNKHSHACPFS